MGLEMNCACGKPIGKRSTSGLCRSCSRTKVYADPAARAVMSKAKKRVLQDPEKRARVATAAAENLRHWHATTDRDWHAWAVAKRARHWDWCPPDRREEYAQLRRSRLGAAEAKRIIQDDIRAKARDEVLRNARAMIDKDARERATRY